jgi:hypothetical protein
MSLKEKIFKKINDRGFKPSVSGYMRFIYCEVSESRISFPKPSDSTYNVLSSRGPVLDSITEGVEIMPPELAESYIEENLNDIFDNIESIKENAIGTCLQGYLWLYYNLSTDRYSLVFWPDVRIYKSQKEVQFSTILNTTEKEEVQ